MNAPIWTPSAEQIESSRLTHYMQWLDRGFRDYRDLWEWSVTHVEEFWASVWEYFQIDASRPYERVLASHKMPGAEWFPGAELSYAEHVFRGRSDDAVAIVHQSEARRQAEMTWGELRALTASIRTGLQACGVGRGDRVIGYLPNTPETVAAFLATASLGAIWSSCSPDFGPRSVIERFAQIDPKVLLGVDGYSYGGKDFDRRSALAEISRGIPGLAHTFVLPYLREEGNWSELLQGGELAFEQLPFGHPLWVLFSSGTTGLPKAIVHGQGGILLEHLKSLHLHCDLRCGDRFFWFTTTGWMMWNFLVGGLLTDAAIVCYDGSPATPDMNRLWDLAESARVTCFGTSAAYISACMKADVHPARDRDLSALRSVGSTGSPLLGDGFRWVYDHLGPDTWLFSMSGGTDVCTAFVGGVPTLPVYDTEIQARALGAKVEAFDELGNSVVGGVGELVLTEPMPSMPIFFWNDRDGSRYRESYFSTYPGIWRHGDWIEFTSRGTAIITGRSDSTINRGGVRMGTAEIYRTILAEDVVVDALVVDVPAAGTDGRMLLFVVLRRGTHLNSALEAAIRARIREECSPRHVPDEIHAVTAIPRTRSGKILEVPVKRILMGVSPEHVVDIESLADSRALDPFLKLAAELNHQ